MTCRLPFVDVTEAGALAVVLHSEFHADADGKHQFVHSADMTEAVCGRHRIRGRTRNGNQYGAGKTSIYGGGQNLGPHQKR